jgi:hypothetical protein
MKPDKENNGWFPLEEALKEAISTGASLDTLSLLIKFLPEERKERYRQIVREMKNVSKI